MSPLQPGVQLFDFAVEFLRQGEPKRIWLTASAEGLPIYQRRGFVRVDCIERWAGQGLGIAEHCLRQRLCQQCLPHARRPQ